MYYFKFFDLFWNHRTRTAALKDASLLRSKEYRWWGVSWGDYFVGIMRRVK